MSDEADLAFYETERLISNGLASARNKTTLPYTGRCYNCDEHIPSPAVFCMNEDGKSDSECREDYEYRLRIERGK